MNVTILMQQTRTIDETIDRLESVLEEARAIPNWAVFLSIVGFVTVLVVAIPVLIVCLRAPYRAYMWCSSGCPLFYPIHPLYTTHGRDNVTRAFVAPSSQRSSHSQQRLPLAARAEHSERPRDSSDEEREWPIRNRNKPIARLKPTGSAASSSALRPTVDAATGHLTNTRESQGHDVYDMEL